MKKITLTILLLLPFIFLVGSVEIPDSIVCKRMFKVSEEGNWEKYILPSIAPIFISLISVFVSIYITRRNIKAGKEALDRQAKIQIATTINKELVNTLRANLSKTLHTSLLLHIERDNGGTEDNIIKLTREIQECGVIFQTHLDAEISSQSVFLKAVDEHIRNMINAKKDLVESDKDYMVVLETFNKMVREILDKE